MLEKIGEFLTALQLKLQFKAYFNWFFLYVYFLGTLASPKTLTQLKIQESISVHMNVYETMEAYASRITID